MALPDQRRAKQAQTRWHSLIQLCCDAELNQQLSSVSSMQISNWQLQQPPGLRCTFKSIQIIAMLEWQLETLANAAACGGGGGGPKKYRAVILIFHGKGSNIQDPNLAQLTSCYKMTPCCLREQLCVLKGSNWKEWLAWNWFISTFKWRINPLRCTILFLKG